LTIGLLSVFSLFNSRVADFTSAEVWVAGIEISCRFEQQGRGRP
jgi:hypothetical protein